MTVSLCGNGVVDTGEQCDDGNTVNGDACSAVCQYELPSCSLTIDSYQSTNPLSLTMSITGYGFGTMQYLSSLSYGDGTMADDLNITTFTHAYDDRGPYTIQATVANILNSSLTATCDITV